MSLRQFAAHLETFEAETRRAEANRSAADHEWEHGASEAQTARLRRVAENCEERAGERRAKMLEAFGGLVARMVPLKVRELTATELYRQMSPRQRADVAELHYQITNDPNGGEE